MTSCIDQGLIIRQLTEKIERTTSPRQRTMLERVREHAVAETGADLDTLMSTLSANPAYHFWGPEGDTGPKGRDGVEAFYTNFVSARLYFLEYNCERIWVDDDGVVMEAVIKTIFPGDILAAFPEAVLGKNPVISGATDIDTGRHYLLTARNVTLWPFDADLMIQGEDSYSSGPMSLRLLEDDELPEGYKALFAGSAPE